MQITITIDGVERTYQGDYYELHTKDWNEIVRLMLDDAKDTEDAEA